MRKIRTGRITPVLILQMYLGLIYGCSHASPDSAFSTIDIVKSDSFTVQLPFNYNSYASLKVQHYQRDGTDYLLLANYDDKSVFEIDIDKKKVSTVTDISVLKKDPYPVFLYHYVGPNRILIYRDATNLDMNHDSVLFIMDTTGKVVEYLELNNYPFRKSGEAKDSFAVGWYHFFDPLETFGERVFVKPSPLYVYAPQWDDFATIKHNVPELGYIDIDNRPGFEEIDFVYPSPSHDMYAGEQLSMTLLPLSKDEVVVGYHKDRRVYKVNVKTGSYNSSEGNYKLISQSMPVPKDGTPHSRPPRNPQSVLFGNMVSADEEGGFIRFAQLPAPKEVPLGDLKAFRIATQWMGYYDKDLRLLAEGVKPAWFVSSAPKPVYMDGKILSVKETDGPTDSLQFYISELVVQWEVTTERIDELRGRLQYATKDGYMDITDFYKTMDVPQGSYILLVPRSGCPYCLDESIDYYLRNMEELKKKNIYLVVCGKENAGKVQGVESEFIIVDEAASIENYLNTSIGNPALMKWTGEKVSKQLIFDPEQVKNMRKLIEQFVE